ncbi:hypothetical protein SELMODRAFT_15875, partial [Selaginella moellendorffii]
MLISGTRINPFSRLGPGDQIHLGGHTQIGVIVLFMDYTCNLIIYIYTTSKSLWTSETHGFGFDCYVLMQEDGNLVIYGSHGTSFCKSLWTSETHGLGFDCWVLMQEDGNLVVYGSLGTSFWSS